MKFKYIEWLEHEKEKADFKIQELKDVDLMNFCSKKSGRQLTALEEVQFTNLFNDTIKKGLIYRWTKCNRAWNKFIQRYAEWLDTEIEIAEKPKSAEKRGRPSKPFEELSDRGKRMKLSSTLELVENSPELLLRAACRSSDSQDMKHAVKALIERQNDVEYLKKVSSPCMSTATISVENALALLLHADLNVKSYNLLRDTTVVNGKKIYPRYGLVAARRDLCLPEGIEITATSANVPWKPLIVHTVQGVVTLCEEDIEEHFKGVNEIDLDFLATYGRDGSSGYHPYHQRLKDTGSDTTMICTHMTALRLRHSSGKIFWLNDTPNSIYSVRPKKYEMAKETKEYINGEKKADEEELQIIQSNPIEISLKSGNFTKCTQT